MGAGGEFHERKQTAIRADRKSLISKTRLITAKIRTRKSQQGGPIAFRDIDIGLDVISRVCNS